MKRRTTEMTDMDEISMLASLRFAPIDPTPSTSVRLERDPPQDAIESLQAQLQSLVARQQACLFDGVGDVHDVRNAIVEVMSLLRDEVDGRLRQERTELIRWLGMREDTETVSERIERLESVDEDDSETLQELLKEQGAIDRELDMLQRRRALNAKSIQLERNRIDTVKKERSEELAALRRLPSHAAVLDRLATLRQTIEAREREVVALDAGIPLFARLVDFLRAAETELAGLLLHNDTDNSETVRAKIRSCLDSLGTWGKESRDKGWRLLEVLIDAERTSYEEALAMIPVKSHIESDSRGTKE